MIHQFVMSSDMKSGPRQQHWQMHFLSLQLVEDWDKPTSIAWQGCPPKVRCQSLVEVQWHFGMPSTGQGSSKLLCEVLFGYCCVFEYSEDFKKCQDVLLYLQFLMLLVFVPAQQAQLFHSTPQRSLHLFQFPALLFKDPVTHLKNIRVEKHVRAQLRVTERTGLC